MDGLLSLTPLMWWHWCLAGLLLIVLEMVVPGVFLLWVGLGAVATGFIAAATGMTGWQMQCLVFVPLVFVSLFLGRRFIKQAPAGRSTLNRRLESYIGNRAEVVQPIVNGKGRIRLGDSVWTARGPDCPVGTVVTINGGEGAELFVTIDEPDTGHGRS